MASNNVHGLYGVKIYTDAMGGAVVLGGVTQRDMPMGTEVERQATSGEVYPRFQSIAAQRPSANFSTLMIARALDNIALGGLAITAAVNTGLDYYAQKFAAGAGRATGASHRKYNIKLGIIIPQRLTVTHRGSAVLTYQSIAVTDGTNDPIVESDSQSLPAGMLDDQRFTLGPVTLESKSLTGVQEFTIDFGLIAVPDSGDSTIFDTSVSIRETAPTWTFRGIDPAWLKSTNIPRAGLAISHTNTKVYLRKRAARAQYVADNVAEHIKFTGSGIAYVDSALDAGGSDPDQTSLVVTLDYDGTNDPIVIDTTSQIV